MRLVMNLVKVATPVLLAMLLAGGCSRQSKPPADPDLVATVGARKIRTAEVQAWMQRRAVSNDPAHKAALLEEVIDHAALVERAKAAGLDQDPELRRAWENLLVSKLREAQLESRLTNAVPTPEQVRQHYQSNLVRFTEPALRRGAILFVELPAKSSPERQAQLKERLVEARRQALANTTKVTAGLGFGALAVEFSEDQSTRYRGGDIGWMQAGRADARYDRLVTETLFALPQAGAVSEVLETPRGFYLVKYDESRAERVKPLAAVQAAIEHQLLVENRKRLESEWKQSVRAACVIEVFPEVLTRIQGALESASPARPPVLE